MSRSFFRIAALLVRLVLFLAIFSLFVACSFREGASITMQHDGESPLRRIAVLPFQSMISEKGESGNARCLLCGAVFHTEPVSGDLHPEKTVERIFLKHLETKTKIELISGEKVAGIYQRVEMEATGREPLTIFRDVGRTLGADGVLVGYVFRFRERKGYAYSVERPASVAFEIHLIRSGDAKIVWKGTYDRTQKALFENLLQLSSFYRERGQWVTVEELTEEGIEEIIKTFPVPQ